MEDAGAEAGSVGVSTETVGITSGDVTGIGRIESLDRIEQSVYWFEQFVDCCVGTGDGTYAQELGLWLGVGRDVGGTVTETVGTVLEDCTGKGRRVSLVRIGKSEEEPSSELKRLRKLDEREAKNGELWVGILRIG